MRVGYLALLIRCPHLGTFYVERSKNQIGSVVPASPPDHFPNGLLNHIHTKNFVRE